LEIFSHLELGSSGHVGVLGGHGFRTPAAKALEIIFADPIFCHGRSPPSFAGMLIIVFALITQIVKQGTQITEGSIVGQRLGLIRLGMRVTAGNQVAQMLAAQVLEVGLGKIDWAVSAGWVERSHNTLTPLAV